MTQDDGIGPVISSRGGSDPAREVAAHYRVPPGRTRIIVEVPADIATAAEKRARRRRLPLARIVEDALRAALSVEGTAVAIAALLVGTAGCGAPAAEAKLGPCELPASLPCVLD